LVTTSETPGVAGLSVVVATVDSAHSIRECLARLRQTVRGIDSEIIVVDASRDGTGDIVEEIVGDAELVRLPYGTLTPDLWAVGIAKSRGRVVGLTTGHCLVPDGWADSLMKRVGSDVVGAAGALVIGETARVLDWAVYYLRYSEFIPFVNRSGDDVHTIPADNAAYDGSEIRRYVDSTASGFWEVDFHRSARAAGKSLAFVAAATAHFGRSFPFMTIAAHRFAHGRHSGSWRVQTGASSAARSVLAAPLVPFVLAARTARRAARVPGHLTRFVASLPIFLVLAASWAAGEAWGAVAGPDARSFRPVQA
jgi:hypothetical protein